MNMVRAGVVAHPSQWASGGYAEIQEARERYSIIDHRALMYLLGIPSIDALRRLHKTWVEEALGRAAQAREGKWTESIAVGSKNFVEMVKGNLGSRRRGEGFPERMRNRVSANPRLLTAMISITLTG